MKTLVTLLLIAVLMTSSAIGIERDDRLSSREIEKKIVKTTKPVEQSETLTANNTESLSNIKTEPGIAIEVYTVFWQVIASGATDGTAGPYVIEGTAGELAVGKANNISYEIQHGYWQAFLFGEPGCCLNNRGNANNDPGDLANIADITFLVSYLFGIPSGPAPVCIEEANANSDPGENANIADITYLVNYLFGIPSGPEPQACP